MLVKALLVFLVTWMCVMGQYHMPNIMADRPIFIGFLVGLVLGDPVTGCIIGAQLELIFLGVVFVGSATSADAASSTAIAVSFAILFGMSQAEVITLGTTLGYIGGVFVALEPVLGELFTPIIDKYIASGNQKMFTLAGMALSFVELSIRPLIAFISILFGGEAVNRLMAMMPEFVLTGVNVAGSILPAVGLTVLASLLWNKKTCIYFLFGFFVMKYLNLEIMFLAIIAVFIALQDVFRYFDDKKKPKPATAAECSAKSIEEDFFS